METGMMNLESVAKLVANYSTLSYRFMAQRINGDFRGTRLVLGAPPVSWTTHTYDDVLFLAGSERGSVVSDWLTTAQITTRYHQTYPLLPLRSQADFVRQPSHTSYGLFTLPKPYTLRKRNKQRDCLHKASHLITGKLAERAVVIGDLSQRQMVVKRKENETRKERNKRRIRNRMVYNDWGLHGFVQLLEYKCLRFGKELNIISERDTSKMCSACKHKQDMPLYKRTYRCQNCGLVMDRDENSAVNIYERFVARLGPHR